MAAKETEVDTLLSDRQDPKQEASWAYMDTEYSSKGLSHAHTYTYPVGENISTLRLNLPLNERLCRGGGPSGNLDEWVPLLNH